MFIYFQTAFFTKKIGKSPKSTICTNFSEQLKKITKNQKMKEKLSTLKKVKKSGKESYQRSYPHYPHFFYPNVWVYIVNLETYVLYKSDKIPFTAKNVKFSLTLLMSKYR